MKVFVDVATVPASDMAGSVLLLFFDKKRYLLGHMPEGSQRAFLARRVKLARMSEVFLSGRTEWATRGGLLGLTLTIADQERLSAINNVVRTDTTVHGGDDTLHLFAEMRPFARKNFGFKVEEMEEREWADENIVVRPLVVRPATPPAEEAGSRKRTYDEANPAVDPIERSRILRDVVGTMFSWPQFEKPRPDSATAQPPSSTGESKPKPKRPKKNGEDTEAGETQRREGNPIGLSRPGNFPKYAEKFPKFLPPAEPSVSSLSYIVLMKPVRGKFLPQVAKSLGVSKGPDFGKLAKGMTVTTASGVTVQPEQVMEPTKEGTGFVVCDVPDPSYVPGLLERPEWTDEKLAPRIGCFFWLLGPGVAEDARIHKFIAERESSKHVVLSHDACDDHIVHHGGARSTTLANQLDEVFFPPQVVGPPATAQLPPNAVAASPGLRFQLEPSWELDYARSYKNPKEPLVRPFSPSTAIAEQEEKNPAFPRIVAETRARLPAFTTADIPAANVEITPLGTGSSIPSKYRNVSATLVRIPGVGSVLLDCGEATLGQLRRYFGRDAADEILRDLKLLYISHLHADHHLGTVAVMRARHELMADVAGDTELNVIAPAPFLKFLDEHGQIEPLGGCNAICTNYFLPGREWYRENWSGFDIPAAALHAALRLARVDVRRADHCPDAFTLALTWAADVCGGFKLAYSGDTKPTDRFVDIGRGATVLVHEATFDDSMADEARFKKHSTVGQALQAGRDMAAWGTVLTHFSQRYPKSAVMEAGSPACDAARAEAGQQLAHGGNPDEVMLEDEEDEEKKEGGETATTVTATATAERKEPMRVLFAYDGMRFRVGDMGRFEALREGLSELYADELEEAKEDEA